MPAEPYISLILPAFNEARVRVTGMQLRRLLPVDDGRHRKHCINNDGGSKEIQDSVGGE